MTLNAPQKFSRDLSEAQMVQLVQNALVVAGDEMGASGDHWPVINSTIRDIMQDWEELQVERAVHEEMKKHLYTQLDEMDRVLPVCTAAVIAEVGPKLKELREIYDAYFTAIDENGLYFGDMDMPMHVKRAEAIIQTLEQQDE